MPESECRSVTFGHKATVDVTPHCGHSIGRLCDLEPFVASIVAARLSARGGRSQVLPRCDAGMDPSAVRVVLRLSELVGAVPSA